MSLTKREISKNHMSSEVNILNQVEQGITRQRPGSGQPISTKKSPLPLRKPGVSGNQRMIIKEPEQHLKIRQLSSNSQKTSSTQQLPIIKSPSQQQKPPIQIDKKIIMMKQEHTITSARGERSQRNSSNQNLSTADTNTKQFNWIDDQLSSQRDSSLNKKRLGSKEKQTTNIQIQKSKLQDNHKNAHPPHNQPKCCIDFTMTSGRNDLTKMLDSIKMEIKQIAEESHQNGMILNMSGIDRIQIKFRKFIDFNKLKRWLTMDVLLWDRVQFINLKNEIQLPYYQIDIQFNSKQILYIKIVMGGCGSREKELREKVGFSQSDYDYALKKFSKMTKQKPGKTDEYFSFEGFKQYFTENPVLAQKLYIFMRNYGGQNYVDSLTFLTVVDLFTRVSMKLQNQLKNLDIYTLFTLVSLSSPDIMQRDAFNLNNVYKISVSYSNAVKLFKELINMQSDKGDILCHDDDQAPILIINNIFENHSLLNYKAFNDKIKSEAPLICKIVKNYIAGKFINKTLRNTLPKLDPSELMNKQLIALLNLSVPWFQKCIAINQIYKYEADTQQSYNFNILGNSLLQAKGPNMILFRHSQKDKDGERQEKYVFGYFSPSQWRVSPDISGNKGSFIFSIHPKFKIFSTNGQQQSKFALLVPIITKRQSQTLNSPLKQGPKQPGLGIGGSGYEHHRIWIDGKQLQGSRLVEDDKTFQSGSILY